MELIPALEIGWLNGWIRLAFEFLIQGFLLLSFPKEVAARLFDRSDWSVNQRVFTIIGKVFSLACLILIITAAHTVGYGIPGYAGALLSYVATPVFLDSSWAFLPAGFTMLLFVIRTTLEDRFLQDELEGYRDYVKRVRYRLLPGVWSFS